MPERGVWVLSDYENTISDNSANDSRHRFDATLGDGSKLYLGTQRPPDPPYTTEYLKVNLYTSETIGNVDWDKNLQLPDRRLRTRSTATST